MDTVTEKDLKMRIPSGILIGGPSQSGKSTLLVKLAKAMAQIFDPKPQSALYYYGEYDPRVHAFDALGVETRRGVPTDEEIDEAPKPLLLILDDLMSNMSGDRLSDLFTKKAHHNNMCVIFVTQYWFQRKAMVARNNAQYMFILKADNALRSVRELGSQLFPGKTKFFMDAYEQATENRGEYIFIDNHPAAKRRMKLRSRIFPGEDQNVYLPS